MSIKNKCKGYEKQYDLFIKTVVKYREPYIGFRIDGSEQNEITFDNVIDALKELNSPLVIRWWRIFETTDTCIANAIKKIKI